MYQDQEPSDPSVQPCCATYQPKSPGSNHGIPWKGEQGNKKFFKICTAPSISTTNSGFNKPGNCSSPDSMLHGKPTHLIHAAGHSLSKINFYLQAILQCASMHTIPKYPDWDPPWDHGVTQLSSMLKTLLFWRGETSRKSGHCHNTW